MMLYGIIYPVILILAFISTGCPDIPFLIALKMVKLVNITILFQTVCSASLILSFYHFSFWHYYYYHSQSFQSLVASQSCSFFTSCSSQMPRSRFRHLPPRPSLHGFHPHYSRHSAWSEFSERKMEAGKWVMACTLLLYRIVSNLVLDKLLGDISQGRPRCSLWRFLYIFFFLGS